MATKKPATTTSNPYDAARQRGYVPQSLGGMERAAKYDLGKPRVPPRYGQEGMGMTYSQTVQNLDKTKEGIGYPGAGPSAGQTQETPPGMPNYLDRLKEGQGYKDLQSYYQENQQAYQDWKQQQAKTNEFYGALAQMKATGYGLGQQGSAAAALEAAFSPQTLQRRQNMQMIREQAIFNQVQHQQNMAEAAMRAAANMPLTPDAMIARQALDTYGKIEGEALAKGFDDAESYMQHLQDMAEVQRLHDMAMLDMKEAIEEARLAKVLAEGGRANVDNLIKLGEQFSNAVAETTDVIEKQMGMLFLPKFVEGIGSNMELQMLMRTQMQKSGVSEEEVNAAVRTGATDTMVDILFGNITDTEFNDTFMPLAEKYFKPQFIEWQDMLHKAKLRERKGRTLLDLAANETLKDFGLQLAEPDAGAGGEGAPAPTAGAGVAKPGPKLEDFTKIPGWDQQDKLLEVAQLNLANDTTLTPQEAADKFNEMAPDAQPVTAERMRQLRGEEVPADEAVKGAIAKARSAATGGKGWDYNEMPLKEAGFISAALYPRVNQAEGGWMDDLADRGGIMTDEDLAKMRKYPSYQGGYVPTPIGKMAAEAIRAYRNNPSPQNEREVRAAVTQHIVEMSLPTFDKPIALPDGRVIQFPSGQGKPVVGEPREGYEYGSPQWKYQELDPQTGQVRGQGFNWQRGNLAEMMGTTTIANMDEGELNMLIGTAIARGRGTTDAIQTPFGALNPAGQERPFFQAVENMPPDIREDFRARTDWVRQRAGGISVRNTDRFVPSTEVGKYVGQMGIGTESNPAVQIYDALSKPKDYAIKKWGEEQAYELFWDEAKGDWKRNENGTPLIELRVRGDMMYLLEKDPDLASYLQSQDASLYAQLMGGKRPAQSGMRGVEAPGEEQYSGRGPF